MSDQVTDLQARVEKQFAGFKAGRYGLPISRNDLELLLAEVKALQAERDKAMRALESLTPSGSEFVNDVERCIAYIKEARTVQHNQILHQHKLREAAESELSQLRQQNRWIPVGEKLPRPGTIVELKYGPAWAKYAGGWGFPDGGGKPTHWRESALPTPPEEE